MKSSRFNVFIPLEDGKQLIFNTFSDSRVIGDHNVCKAIKQCGQPASLTETQKQYLSQLKDIGIVLDDFADEEKQLEYWFQRLKYNTKTLNATILTTMACNMNCVYCFEQGALSSSSMNRDMVSHVCEWLLQRVDEVRPQNLAITFFGGEPLLNLDAVYALSEKLFHETKERRVRLTLDLITNGIFLNRSVVEKLIPLGLQWVKVTLDGDQKTHDRMRPLKGKDIHSGTYHTIINNLKDIRGKVPIIIGGNYDEATKSSIPALLDDLLDQGFLPEHFRKIAFKPILTFPGHEGSSAHSIEACTFSQTKVEDFLWLIKEIESRGFPSYKKIALGPCEAMREHAFVIAPNGDLYKCAAMSGRKEYSIGNIQSEMANILFSHQNVGFMASDSWRQCKSCKFVPICGGGCRLSCLSSGGGLDAIACEKEYFEKVSTKLVLSEHNDIC